MKAKNAPSISRLEPGERLSRPEFHRRYEQMPDLRRAELIEGMVFLESPVRYRAHGKPQSDILHWLNTYALATPGTVALGSVTLILDEKNELEPDAILFRAPESGGRCRVNPEDYLEGAPELVVEISASTAARDYGRKLGVYRRHSVPEVLIWRTEKDIVDWFILRAGRYEPLEADPAGILRGEIFPGLTLALGSLFAGDLRGVLEELERGIARRHAE
jgi:Uma2 family endonuclease